MLQQISDMNCRQKSWALAALAGFLLFILLMGPGDWGFFGALFISLIVGVIAGFVLLKVLCADADEAGSINTATPAASTSRTASTKATPTAAPAPKPAAAPEAKPVEAAPAADPVTAASVAEPTPAAAPATASDARPEVSAASAKADAEAGAKVKPSTPLKGQEELAQRKGAWKYEAAGSPAATTAPAKKATPAKAAPATEVTPDYDGDGKLEGANEGKKPATLSAAREGGPDNLKEIKGVGPKLEKLLHSMGFYHFDQIANWTPDEEAWVNANLAGFKGRVSRDEWVKQAKILAAGGDTEFSKRVDKGGVY